MLFAPHTRSSLLRSTCFDGLGECFFLLENRGAKVTLRYGSEKFSLDTNLLIIGTMNTRDRNLDQQMDVAFVQRFKWVEVCNQHTPANVLSSHTPPSCRAAVSK